MRSLKLRCKRQKRRTKLQRGGNNAEFTLKRSTSRNPLSGMEIKLDKLDKNRLYITNITHLAVINQLNLLPKHTNNKFYINSIVLRVFERQTFLEWARSKPKTEISSTMIYPSNNNINDQTLDNILKKIEDAISRGQVTFNIIDERDNQPTVSPSSLNSNSGSSNGRSRMRVQAHGNIRRVWGGGYKEGIITSTAILGKRKSKRKSRNRKSHRRKTRRH